MQWDGQARPEEQTTQAWSPAEESGEQSSWGQPGDAGTSEETSVLDPSAENGTTDPASEEPGRDDRPGWWNPSS